MPKKLLVIISLLVTTLLVGFIGIPYYQDARLSRATAVLQIHPTTGPGCFLSGPENSRAGHLAKILGPETLSLAVKSLQSGVPATEEDTAFLEAQLEVSPGRETDFIRITAKHQSREQAILIANAVVEAYLSQQTDWNRERVELALAELDKKVLSQFELVHRHWLEFISVCKRLGLDGPFFKDNIPDFPEVKNAGNENKLKALELEFSQCKESFLTSRTILCELKFKQQEFREILKDPPIFVSIHRHAE